jgi:hypothetical protein
MASPPSWSRYVTETVRGSHHYTVKGFSLAKGMGPGRYLTSDVFAVGGYNWAVYLYPDGKNPDDNAAYVSVFVALVSHGADVRAPSSSLPSWTSRAADATRSTPTSTGRCKPDPTRSSTEDPCGNVLHVGTLAEPCFSFSYISFIPFSSHYYKELKF